MYRAAAGHYLQQFGFKEPFSDIPGIIRVQHTHEGRRCGLAQTTCRGKTQFFPICGFLFASLNNHRQVRVVLIVLFTPALVFGGSVESRVAAPRLAGWFLMSETTEAFEHVPPTAPMSCNLNPLRSFSSACASPTPMVPSSRSYAAPPTTNSVDLVSRQRARANERHLSPRWCFLLPHNPDDHVKGVSSINAMFKGSRYISSCTSGRMNRPRTPV